MGKARNLVGSGLDHSSEQRKLGLLQAADGGKARDSSGALFHQGAGTGGAVIKDEQIGPAMSEVIQTALPSAAFTEGTLDGDGPVPLGMNQSIAV